MRGLEPYLTANRGSDVAPFRRHSDTGACLFPLPRARWVGVRSRLEASAGALTCRAGPVGLPGPKVLEARGIRTTPSNLGTPAQPTVGVSNPAEIDWLGTTEPTKRKS